jgi:hypothetical protein
MAIADPLFQKIGWQLIHTPESSQTALEHAAANPGQRPDDAGAGVAIDMAKGWIGNILTEEFQPPADAAFAAIPAEAGVCDVVRAAWRAGGLDLEVAQTFSMFNVSIKNTPEKTNPAAAERLAKRLLTAAVIAFDPEGEEAGFAYGKQHAPCNPLQCDWMELLRWWSTASNAGFLTVKTTKSKERAVVSPDEDHNRIWFDLYNRR